MKNDRDMPSYGARGDGRLSLRGLASLLAVTLALGGCAFGQRDATLRYPPEAEAGTGVITAARAAPAPGSRRIEIVLSTFSDARKDKTVTSDNGDLVGSVRNGFGMPTAQIVTKDSLPAWVTGAVKTELTNAGYQVTDAAGGSPSAVTISGDLTHVWADAYFKYNGEVTLTVRLRRSGQDLLTKTYEGEGSAGTNWAATASAYSQSLSLALADALKKMMVDVDKTLSAP